MRPTRIAIEPDERVVYVRAQWGKEFGMSYAMHTEAGAHRLASFLREADMESREQCEAEIRQELRRMVMETGVLS